LTGSSIFSLDASIQRPVRWTGGVELSHQVGVVDQLTNQEQAGVGRQGRVVGSGVNGAASRGGVHLKRASWWDVGGIEASPLSQFQLARFAFLRPLGLPPYSRIQV